MARRLLGLLPALLLAACTAYPAGPQIPGRRGLTLAMERLETATAWRDWPLVLDAFYLPEHAEEVKRAYSGDIGEWFRAGKEMGSLGAGDLGRSRRVCPLAFREKHYSPRFEPHFVVYFRVQEEPCGELLSGEAPPALAIGQMEWGYETVGRRWVHLRPLAEAASRKP